MRSIVPIHLFVGAVTCLRVETEINVQDQPELEVRIYKGFVYYENLDRY